MEFINLDPKLKNGMADFLKFHRMENLALRINIEKSDFCGIKISKKDNEIRVWLSESYMIFRALTIIKPNAGSRNFDCCEKCFFKMGGPMFDGSQASSLMNIESVKKMLLISAGMGFNTMMLYCEDCYDIEGEPYFGNMRPRYSKDDFKLLDDYAYSLGIELVPCIQTLGHLTGAMKKSPYKAISDSPSVLMVGDDRTYVLIDKMLKTMSECFRSRKIHIGLDEAFGLGTGNYLIKNGYKAKTEIMKVHLARVYELTQKYGFRPMMWCDMFFSAKSKRTTDTYFDPDVSFDETDKETVPNGMSLIYWDYYHFDEKHYEMYFDKIKFLNDDVIFAGCARNVRTFGCHGTKGMLTTKASMNVCKRLGIDRFIATVWGDDHRESSTFAVLPQLQYFAEHMYGESPEKEKIEKRFEACVNAKWEDFENIEFIDAVSDFNGDNRENVPLSKAMMWQNVLLGLFDDNIKNGRFKEHYSKLKEKFALSAEKYPEYAYMFDFYYHTANVLEDKSEIGLKIAEAYKKNNVDALREYVSDTLPKLEEKMKNLRIAHRNYFYYEYKPIGWETLDIRYGGAVMGIDTAIKRISDYLDEKITKIDELEEKRLSFSEDGSIPPGINYDVICSANGV